MSEHKKTVTIDGSHGEGGGQILRTACALSAVTAKPCRIYDIRKNRKSPGLRYQHMLGLRALAKLCDGRLHGDEVGSTEVVFEPGTIKAQTIDVEIPTAGSISLVLQTLLLPSFYAPGAVNIRFRGGATDTFFAPTIDYHRFVFAALLNKIGLSTSLDIEKRGFYPKGDARVTAATKPGKPQNLICMERGSLQEIMIISGASQNLSKAKVAERQAQSAKELIERDLGCSVEIQIEYHNTLSAGTYINVIAIFENTVIGSSSLGEKKKRAEKVGVEAGKRFIREFDSGACIDVHAGDQIVPYLALADGSSSITVPKVSEHTETNLWVIRHFLDRQFEIEKKERSAKITIL